MPWRRERAPSSRPDEQSGWTATNSQLTSFDASAMVSVPCDAQRAPVHRPPMEHGRGDVCPLAMASIDWEGEILRVAGKGRSERSMPLHPLAAETLCAYLAIRPLEPLAQGALFASKRRGPTHGPGRGVLGDAACRSGCLGIC